MTSGDYCDHSAQFFLKNQEVVDYLIKNDPQLLRDIVKNNEVHEELCGV
jgi:hypothetical protein